jgi:hypothetical protein
LVLIMILVSPPAIGSELGPDGSGSEFPGPDGPVPFNEAARACGTADPHILSSVTSCRARGAGPVDPRTTRCVAN